ncbi:universal stress protein [Aureisphaera galaxeae]|uniref:universal stress protein n=1 Tax=Aureisphaera galaxeae TaxID=1538023 RepID=UPI002350A5C7|nr:universal stress protein [Aureisphaera galaxeae]MDC8003778.1 universal stress protein [Aureisphaera galaxeae]
MKKKILIPTDFSRNAWGAICYALELFKNEECDIYILNCYDLDQYTAEELASSPFSKSKHRQALLEKSENELKKISQRISFRDESPEHVYYYLSSEKNLIPAMKDVIERKDIDLVVMGTKGKTDSLNVAFGSNAVMAMEKIRNCPVMAIPPGILFSEPNEIVFPTSFRTHFKRRELQYLIEIARITNAPIRVLHVRQELELDEEQKNYKALLEEYFEGLEYSFHTLENTSIHVALRLFVQSRESEMIAFINKKHTFFNTVFNQPMVKKIGVDSEIPILAMHDLRN